MDDDMDLSDFVRISMGRFNEQKKPVVVLVQGMAQRIEDLEAWKAQAVTAMQRVLDDDYERPVKKRWRKDGIPSKHDECPHELPMWQDCGLCMDVAIAEILAEALAYGEVTDNTPVYPLD